MARDGIELSTLRLSVTERRDLLNTPESLTDRRIASIRPTNTRVEYVDQKVPGLALRVTPNGAKSWTVRYRHRGRLRRLMLGDLAVVSLADARARERDALHNALRLVTAQRGGEVVAMRWQDVDLHAG